MERAVAKLRSTLCDRPNSEHPRAMPDIVRVSRFLSLVLRHQPDTIGLTLDSQGWADVEELLERLAMHGRP